jgi:hypothetical protein
VKADPALPPAPEAWMPFGRPGAPAFYGDYNHGSFYVDRQGTEGPSFLVQWPESAPGGAASGNMYFQIVRVGR